MFTKLNTSMFHFLTKASHVLSVNMFLSNVQLCRASSMALVFAILLIIEVCLFPEQQKRCERASVKQQTFVFISVSG